MQAHRSLRLNHLVLLGRPLAALLTQLATLQHHPQDRLSVRPPSQHCSLEGRHWGLRQGAWEDHQASPPVLSLVWALGFLSWPFRA